MPPKINPKIPIYKNTEIRIFVAVMTLVPNAKPKPPGEVSRQNSPAVGFLPGGQAVKVALSKVSNFFRP